MKLNLDDFIKDFGNDPMVAKVFDLDLPASHRLHESQLFFRTFVKPFEKYGIEVSTFAMHNDENLACFHWKDDSYVFACMLDDEKPYIEISKLLDSENLFFEVLEEIPYSIEALTSKLNQYIALSLE